MNLRQLSYFRAVVDHGSIVAASEELRVAQPPLSVAIKQLEEQWGVRLFDRVGRGLVITEVGRALYDRACNLLGSASAIEQEMAAIGRGFSARIRVGFTALSIEPVAEMITRIREGGAAITFSLHQGEPKLLEDMVEQGDLDFAFTHLPVANAALHVDPLFALRIAVIARADDDRFPRDGLVRIQQLDGIPLILLRRSAGTGIYDRVTTRFREASISCNIIVDSSDLAAIYALISRHIGIGILPFWPGLQLPSNLAIRAIAETEEVERIALIYGRGRLFLPSVQKAVEMCRAAFSKA
jgi:DNA-binding transcriptional LysR family regulator